MQRNETLIPLLEVPEFLSRCVSPDFFSIVGPAKQKELWLPRI